MYSRVFEDLLVQLNVRSLSRPRLIDPTTEEHDVFVFVSAVAARYRCMREHTEAFLADHQKRMAEIQSKIRVNLTLEQVSLDSVVFQSRVNAYFDLIQEVYRFGLFFQNNLTWKGRVEPMPKFQHIEFFRNKYIEHWADYYHGDIWFKSAGWTWRSEQVLVPGLRFWPWDVVRPRYEELADCFGLFNVFLPVSDEAHQGCLSDEEIYGYLEKIPAYPFRKGGKRQVSSPHEKKLMDALFKFGFPVAIMDIEDYMIRLGEWCHKELISKI